MIHRWPESYPGYTMKTISLREAFILSIFLISPFLLTGCKESDYLNMCFICNPAASVLPLLFIGLTIYKRYK